MKIAPAKFLGWQETCFGSGFALYTLTEGIPGHPKDSTVSSRTLVELGYRLPETDFRGGSK